MEIKKINIGAGNAWYAPGWESLDFDKKFFIRSSQHHGVAWRTKLPSNTYDLLFAGNILEHVTHYRIEKVLAEFNRIMKIGGTIRITVPDLELAAKAYIDKNKSFFTNDRCGDTGDLGVGGMFVRTIVSSGHEVVALTSDFTEILGRYAHLYAYDFDMLKILLEKWGFEKVERSTYTGSNTPEMSPPQVANLNGEICDNVYDEKVAAAIAKDPRNNYITGFDSHPEKTLFIEAVKLKDSPYSLEDEFPYNRNNCDAITYKIKLKCFRCASVLVDFFLIKLHILFLLKTILGKHKNK